MTIYCASCEQALDWQIQAIERKIDGEFKPVGGFLILTCWNTDCCMCGKTHSGTEHHKVAMKVQEVK